MVENHIPVIDEMNHFAGRLRIRKGRHRLVEIPEAFVKTSIRNIESALRNLRNGHAALDELKHLSIHGNRLDAGVVVDQVGLRIGFVRTQQVLDSHHLRNRRIEVGCRFGLIGSHYGKRKLVAHQSGRSGNGFHFCACAVHAERNSLVQATTSCVGLPSQVRRTFPSASSNRVNGKCPCGLYRSASASFRLT